MSDLLSNEQIAPSSPSTVKTVFSVFRGAIKTLRGSPPAAETASGECCSDPTAVLLFVALRESLCV